MVSGRAVAIAEAYIPRLDVGCLARDDEHTELHIC